MKPSACIAVTLLALASSCGGSSSPPIAPDTTSSPDASPSSDKPGDKRSAPQGKAEKADAGPEKKAASPAPSAAASSAAASSPAAPPAEPQLPEVVFQEVEPSPAPANLPTVAISSPKKNAVIPSSKAADTVVKFDVKGWELSGGNHVQLIVDNRPYLRVDDLKRVVKLRDVIDAGDLGPGQHFVAAILARGNGETVKPVGKKVPAAVVPFFIDSKKDVQWKEGGPLLIYSSPQSGPAPKEGVLVDFYVINAQIKQGNVVVHASVSGPGLRAGESLSEWKPWRVRNARPGLYAIQVGLFQFEAAEFDSAATTAIATVSKPVAGRWNTVTREFVVPAR